MDPGGLWKCSVVFIQFYCLPDSNKFDHMAFAFYFDKTIFPVIELLFKLRLKNIKQWNNHVHPSRAGWSKKRENCLFPGWEIRRNNSHWKIIGTRILAKRLPFHSMANCFYLQSLLFQFGSNFNSNSNSYSNFRSKLMRMYVVRLLSFPK